MDVGFAIERIAQHRPQIGRERDRFEPVDLDHAGIAVGCALARFLTIDQRDSASASLQLQRDGNAGHSSAENYGINGFHVLPTVRGSHAGNILYKEHPRQKKPFRRATGDKRTGLGRRARAT